MFDSLKRKVLLDLFVSPWTVVPIVGGLSAFLVSWGLDGVTALNVAGLAGLLVGSGIQATRLIFGIEEITENAQTYLKEQEAADEAAELDALQRRLLRDGDPRTQKCLKTLRVLTADMRREAEETGSPTTLAVLGKVEELSATAVAQLERAYGLWDKARKLPRSTARPLMARRQAAVDEVVETIEHLVETIARYHDGRAKKGSEGLSRLRGELDQTLEMARRAEERIDAIGRETGYDEREFE